MAPLRALRTLALLLTLPFTTLAVVSDNSPLELSYYRPSDPVVFECLNRTIDTGEHIQDSHGHLLYTPFLRCAETSSPLSIPFNSEGSINCTIPKMTEDLFHLFEFYIHADSPFSCRVPSRPRGWGQRALTEEGGKVDTSMGGSEDGTEWIPVVLNLAGTIELSHVHIANDMNLIFHTAKDPASGGQVIQSGIAYSSKPLTGAKRVKMGDALELRFKVKWYEGEELPESNVVVVGRRRWGWIGMVGLVGLVAGYVWGVKAGKRRGGQILPTWEGSGGHGHGGWGKAD